MGSGVGDAYSHRSAEYSELFGSMDAVHPADRQLVSAWAGGIVGCVIDAGCGPGHWTNFLGECGIAARGVDLVPEFIDRARSTYPGVRFELGSLDTLDAATGTVGGVLSWYSLIHHEPGSMRIPLTEFGRVLRPGGALLIGFFEGQVIERFAHAVAPAYRWTVGGLGDELDAAGFDVVGTTARATAGRRPHAAITARRRESH